MRLTLPTLLLALASALLPGAALAHGPTPQKVEQTITSDTEAAGRTVRASEDDPQYLVRSDKSGGDAVHKPSALHRA